MVKTAAERMSAYRSRKRASGITALSLLVPKDDVALFREFAAMRCAQRKAVARSIPQRRVAGRAVINAPDAIATARAVGLYLEFRQIGPTDILETREILERAMIELAVQRLTRDGEIRLRNDIATETALDGTADPQAWQQLHYTIAELSGDLALSLFAGIILRLSGAHSNFARRPKAEQAKVVARVKKLHRGIVDAMIERDAGRACHHIGRYLAGYKEWID